jgi:hypothetical protein
VNKTIVIGLSVLLYLYLAFGLMGCAYSKDINGGMVDNDIGDGVQHYTLWTWVYVTNPPGWWGLVGLTQADCIERRDRYHLRGAGLDAQENDPDLEAHRPVCLPDGRGWAKGTETFPDQESCLKTSGSAERKAGIECHPIGVDQSHARPEPAED